MISQHTLLFPACTSIQKSSPDVIQDRLLSLPFPLFARTVAQLLERMGYRDVRLMGATHGKGRNQYGGLDLMARLPNDLTQAIVLAQVKQYKGPVPRSFVDELRGTMLRLGAQQGLIVTTSSFAQAARDAASAAQHSLPVRLISGQELAALLTLYRIEIGGQGEDNRIAACRNRRCKFPARPVGSGDLRLPPAVPTEPRRLPCPSRTPRSVTITITVDPQARDTNPAGG